jgi:hypothetical protein
MSKKTMHIYREEGFEIEVLVLKDESDSEWLRYTLQCVRVIRESTTTVNPKVNEVFSVASQRDVLHLVGWSLVEVDAWTLGIAVECPICHALPGHACKGVRQSHSERSTLNFYSSLPTCPGHSNCSLKVLRGGDRGAGVCIYLRAPGQEDPQLVKSLDQHLCGRKGGPNSNPPQLDETPAQNGVSPPPEKPTKSKYEIDAEALLERTKIQIENACCPDFLPTDIRTVPECPWCHTRYSPELFEIREVIHHGDLFAGLFSSKEYHAICLHCGWTGTFTPIQKKDKPA